LGITWSATQIRYDHWYVFYASTHVLLVLVLTLLFGWVCAGLELAAVVFGRPTKAKEESSSGVDDPWLD
jgi:hypothetical protein